MRSTLLDIMAGGPYPIPSVFQGPVPGVKRHGIEGHGKVLPVMPACMMID
jgi:hypothetical protein